MAKKRDNGARPVERTPAGEWAQESELVTLPSGKTAELRRPDLVDLIASGEAPDVLTNLILDQINGKRRGLDVTGENLPAIFQTVNAVARATFVYPRLVEGEAQAEDEVALRAVSFADKTFVFNWALGVQYQAAESFRAGQAGGVQPVPAVQDVRESAERDVRDTPQPLAGVDVRQRDPDVGDARGGETG